MVTRTEKEQSRLLVIGAERTIFKFSMDQLRGVTLKQITLFYFINILLEQYKPSVSVIAHGTMEP